MYRPVLAPLHAGLLLGLARSIALQRDIVARTETLPRGQIVSIGGHSVEIERSLGHGMMAVTYAVTCQKTGRSLALKRARAAFDLFRQVFAAEAEASRQLPELAGISTAPIIAADDYHLLKPLYTGSTLQALIVTNAVECRHKNALIDTLGRCKQILRGGDFCIDPSPKNLCWGGDGWVLLDTGQPLIASRFPHAVLEEPSWTAYLAYYADKLGTSRSQPSALTAGFRPDDVDPGQATRYAFLREWWIWLPIVDGGDKRDLLATFDPGAVDDEILYLIEAGHDHWQLRPAPRGDPGPESHVNALRRAVEEWRRTYPDRLCRYSDT